VGFGEAISLVSRNFGLRYSRVAISNIESAAHGRKRRKTGRRAIALKANVAVPRTSLPMVDATVREFGGVDILVNCAGIPQHDPAELTPLETWDRVLDINLRGTFLCCQAAARVMLKKGSSLRKW